MKNTIYLFVFLLCYLPLKAQQIIFKGVLYEHNSKTNTGKLKAIQNAQIIIPFTVPSTTDNMGKFKTESDGYKVGQSTKIIIKKAGYEVVNIKDLENVVAGSIDEVKVYLAPQNLLYEAQLKYYNLAKKSIETSYDVKLNKLINDLNKNICGVHSEPNRNVPRMLFSIVPCTKEEAESDKKARKPIIIKKGGNIGDNFYLKYMKYKAKYVQLKSKII